VPLKLRARAVVVAVLMTFALADAIATLTRHPRSSPPAAELVDILLDAEKTARRKRQSIRYEQLIGTWQLRFITGTTRSRKSLGKLLGPGFYIPPWLGRICLSYEHATDAKSLSEHDRNLNDLIGQVQNVVSMGPMTIQLTGPTRYWPKPRSLAFDFTQFAFRVGPQKLYGTTVADVKERRQNVLTQTLKHQAFFSYFYASDDGIAARGRGGGLALWTRYGDTPSGSSSQSGQE